MQSTRQRGRPVGTGKYGQKSRVARVPASLTDAELASTLELPSILLELLLEGSPYKPGSVRDETRDRIFRSILDVYESLGLPVSPTMEASTGIPQELKEK